jgi:hypothetical protein
MLSGSQNTSTEEFSKKVILVHPLQSNSILDFIYKTGKDQLAVFDTSSGSFNVLATAVNAIAHDNSLLSDEAVIGSHLNFSDDQYHDSFVDRPHIHWWWNGLFQANSGGDWEQSFFAYLEPLNQFDNVMGCAPYDTMTMGPHQLSDESCILVPLACGPLLQARLKNYKGKILTYDHVAITLRDAINQTMKTHYPDALNLVNKNGLDINKTAMSRGDQNFNQELCQESDYNPNTGYFNSLYIDSPDFPLMRGEGKIQLAAYDDYAKGKLVGLHRSSPTDVESNPLIKILKAVSLNPKKIGQYSHNFLNGQDNKNINELCLLAAYAQYKKLNLLALDTGAHNYARYLLTKAFIAEFQLIAHQLEKGIRPEEELRAMVEKNYSTLITSLEALFSAAQLPNDSAMQHYKKSMISEYSDLLKKAYVSGEKSFASTRTTPENSKDIKVSATIQTLHRFAAASSSAENKKINSETAGSKNRNYTPDSLGLFPPKPSECFLKAMGASPAIQELAMNTGLDQQTFGKLSTKLSLLIVENKKNPPETKEQFITTCDEILDLIKSENTFSPVTYLFKAKAFEWMLELLLTYHKKNPSDDDIKDKSLAITKELLVNIKISLALILDNRIPKETTNINLEVLQTTLDRKFNSYLNYYTKKLGYTTPTEKTALLNNILDERDSALAICKVAIQDEVDHTLTTRFGHS